MRPFSRLYLVHGNTSLKKDLFGGGRLRRLLLVMHVDVVDVDVRQGMKESAK